MNGAETSLTSLQQEPADARARPRLSAPRKVLRFLALSIEKASADDLTQKSAALSFTTLLALIPLLAAFSYVGARWFDQKRELAVEVLIQLLPYSEETILTHLQGFLDHAKTIRGVGFVLLLFAALAAFTTIEKTVNRIWNVPHRRPFRSRLLSFTMVVFWGPLVIGATYWSLFRLQPVIARSALALPAGIIPFAMTLLGLTMLYWLVPYTKVQFRSALAGGLFATLLLEALRQGFGLYVGQARNISIIYGGFGFALLFMISIQAAWWITLLGSEVAYCLQNHQYMSQRRHDAAPAAGSWLGLSALALIARRFMDGDPITPHEVLAERLQLETEELRRALVPLLAGGVLRETGGDDEGYLLAGDPHDLPVAKVFGLYEGLQQRLVEPLQPPLAERLESLREGIAESRGRRLEDVVLADLVARRPPSSGEDEEERSSPAPG